jgi:putative ABC transport system permease protein
MGWWSVVGVRTTVRSLLHRPGFTLTAVATLALGVGANAGLFSVVRRVVLAPLPLPEAHRLVEVWESDATRDRRRPSPGNFLDLREGASAFSGLSAFVGLGVTLTGGEVPLRLQAAAVSSNFFRTLAIDPALGRSFDPAATDDPLEVVLSYGLWQRAFGGDPGVLGRTLVLDGLPHEVVGVTPRGFAFPDRAELWMRAPRDVPVDLSFAGDVTTIRDAWFHRVVGRMAPGIDARAAQAEVDLLAARLEEAHPEENAALRIRLTPLKEELVGPLRGGLLLLLGATAMVLLVACANVANMSLVRLSRRRRELAVRRSLGADRGHLAVHVLGEAVVLAILGSGVGVAIAFAGVHILRPRVEPLLPAGAASLAVDSWALVYAAGIAVASGLLSGGLPAWLVTRAGEGGRGGMAPGRVGGRFLKRAASALVAGEVAAAVVLVLGSVLLLRSLDNLGRVDPGFDTDGVTFHSVALPPDPSSTTPGGGTAGDPDRFRRLVRELEGRPGLASAGWTQTGPLDVGPGAGIRTLDGGPEEWASQELPSVQWQVVDEGYFRTLGVPLAAGRDFRPSDASDTEPVAIVNRALSRAVFGDADPVGRRVNTGLDGRTPTGEWLWVRIVGVVEDTRNRGPAAAPAPVLFRPLSQGGAGFRGETLILAVREAGGGEGEGVRPLQASIQGAIPGAAIFRTRRGVDLIAPYAAERRVVLALLGGFAALALTLGVVGIHAVTSAAVGRRTREVGIRMALGADRHRIVGRVVGQGMLPVGLGLVLGLAASALGAAALRDLLFEVSPFDLPTFLFATALLLLSALVATWLPARTASLVDPVRAIRGE